MGIFKVPPLAQLIVKVKLIFMLRPFFSKYVVTWKRSIPIKIYSNEKISCTCTCQ